MAKITPAAKPTEILAKFCTDQGAANRNRPINAKGTLFKDPTKEYMVGVVVEINQREVKLMAKPRRPLKSATAKNRNFFIKLLLNVNKFLDKKRP